MAKHFLVFLDGRWQRTNRLPVAKVAPPEPHQIRWCIRGWNYVVCEKKRVWRLPHVNGRGVQKTWKEVLIQERRVGYKGVDFWRDGVCRYFSLRQLRGLLVRQQPHAEEAGTHPTPPSVPPAPSSSLFDKPVAWQGTPVE